MMNIICGSSETLTGRVKPNFNDVMPIVASLRPLPAPHLPRHEVM
jgi:hypothetical protein